MQMSFFLISIKNKFDNFVSENSNKMLSLQPKQPLMATKTYKSSKNTTSIVSEPMATYTQPEISQEPIANNTGRMSVEEYFGKVWTEVLKKY